MFTASLKEAMIGLLLTSSAVKVFGSATENNGTGTACNLLAATFPSKTFAPGSANYTLISQTDIYSETCVLEPGCVFMAANEDDVAQAISFIYETNTVFSVVSGGHMPVPGAQSNNGGVMLALTNLDNKTLSDDHSVASIGPGNRWVEVYTWLQPYGLAVAGGRYSSVGVGGVLIGGGINFFGNRYGFSVNTIVGVQVVLGNGSIVEASATSHADLFWALKGGNNNYGVVTRFDLNTIPITSAYGGIAGWLGTDLTSQFVQAIEDFLLSPEGIDDPYTEINPSITVQPSYYGNGTGLWESVLVPFVAGNYSSVSGPPSLVNFTNLPDPVSISVLGQEDNYVDILNTVESINTEDIYGKGQIYGCLSAKIAPGVVQLAVDTVLTPALTQLANVSGAFVAISPEAISSSMLQVAHDSGPYAIDLDPDDGAFIIILATVTWDNASDDELVQTFMNNTLTNLENVLVQNDLFYNYIYINDAAPGQYPYSTYGNGQSLDRMKAVQTSYDPLGVFKDLITSGFKL
ncbi:FAD-binding domain-containing protein [Cryphonectria parasitica EP155]|uniref:FAD-binding domain-containing protein n=1 Tax=Cryphonectria parasitica (strain ATCC 38755 / EP155) TaxID=660469 RepID=A0A9P4XT36_CRYP1|nr:FAD-binding domain-containing protein [Cryphonectria parasitica EP155]KAF3760411.1 FAD-binding domain-containing protein [Cryphonectria parasitica EP155]